MAQTIEEKKRKNAERSKRWREAHPDYMKTYMKDYREVNGEAMRAADRKYHAEHREEKNARSKTWREANPARAAAAQKGWYAKPENQTRKRAHRFKAKYGITIEEYNRRLEEQGGRCKLCGQAEPRGRGMFHVDHDHRTGEIRGLLCHGCNTGIGCLKEDAALLERAALYVRTCGKSAGPPSYQIATCRSPTR